MRNGTNDAYAAGEADEIALYTRALSAAEIQSHYDLANDLADDPLPTNPDDPPGEPPTAGTGPGGDALAAPSRTATPGPPSGPVAISGARLIIRGAPGVRNSLTARKRGRRWLVRDTLAAAAAGPPLQGARPAARELPRGGREAHRHVRRGGQRPHDRGRPHSGDLPRRPGPRRDPPRPLADYTENLPSRCSSSPSTVIEPPWRRSQTMSQWTAELFVPPLSG